MEKKYYYDCPIQALYMYKEFGVKFYLDDGEGTTHPFISNDDEIEISDFQYLEMCEGYDKIYIEIISEHIFEPKEGDLGQMKAEGARFFVKYSERSKEWKEWHGGGYYSDKNGSDIIYRDGKHFFNPKEED